MVHFAERGCSRCRENRCWWCGRAECEARYAVAEDERPRLLKAGSASCCAHCERVDGGTALRRSHRHLSDKSWSGRGCGGHWRVTTSVERLRPRMLPGSNTRLKGGSVCGLGARSVHSRSRRCRGQSRSCRAESDRLRRLDRVREMHSSALAFTAWLRRPPTRARRLALETRAENKGPPAKTYRVARALFSRGRLISEASLPVFQRGWGRIWDDRLDPRTQSRRSETLFSHSRTPKLRFALAHRVDQR